MAMPSCASRPPLAITGICTDRVGRSRLVEPRPRSCSGRPIVGPRPSPQLVRPMATMHGESGDDRLLSQAVAMADELGAYEIAARARRYLALAVQRRDEPALTRSLYEEALRTARQGGVRLEEAFALAALGFLLAQAGDLSGAVPLIDEALAVGSEVGDVVPCPRPWPLAESWRRAQSAGPTLLACSRKRSDLEKRSGTRS